MPDASQDPTTLIQSIVGLFAALGLSTTAGFRAYLPLVVLGVASDLGAIQLQPNFKLLGSPIGIGILLILMVAEFIVDKIPVVDHISDVIHTVVRPASGAIIMAGTLNPLTQAHHPGIAAVIGAVIALSFHGAKATTRPAVSATTGGIGNPVVSTLEDIGAVVVAVLSVIAPVLAIVLVALFLIFSIRVVARIFRRLTGRGRAGAPAAPANAPARAPVAVVATPAQGAPSPAAPPPYRPNQLQQIGSAPTPGYPYPAPTRTYQQPNGPTPYGDDQPTIPGTF